MAFLQSLLAANLYLAIYFAYPHAGFIQYATWQLIATSVTVLLETPLLQVYISARANISVPKATLYAKLIIGSGVFVAAAVWTHPAPEALMAALLACTPTSWQVSGRTHAKSALKILLTARIVLLALGFCGLPLHLYVKLYCLTSIMLGSLLCDGAKASLSELRQLPSIYVRNISYVFRPAVESIAFNSASLTIIKSLPTAEGSYFFVFLRVIASSVSLTQTILYTDSIKERHHRAVKATATSILILGPLGASLLPWLPGLNVPVAVAFAGGAIIASANQYYSNYLAKLRSLRWLDAVNGFLFALGICAIAGLSLLEKQFIVIASAYLFLESLVGLNSARVLAKRQ